MGEYTETQDEVERILMRNRFLLQIMAIYIKQTNHLTKTN